MIEAYKIGIDLLVSSNATRVLDAVMKQLVELDRLIKLSGDATNRMLQSQNRMTGVLRANAGYAADTARALEAAAKVRLPAVSAAARTTAAGARAGSHDMMMAGLGAAAAGAFMTSFYATAVKKGMDIGHLKAILSADDRVTPAQIKAASDQAAAVAKSVPGSTIAGNLGMALDLKQVTGSLDEAIAAMPSFAKLVVTLEALDKRTGGTGDQAFSAAKALEILGRMTVPDPAHPGGHIIDVNELGRAMQLMTQVAVGTNGRVSPSDYLGFAKQSRVGGMALDDKALFRDFPALLMVLGGNRAGTGEAATYQQFINGQMTKQTAEMLKKFGLIDGTAKWSGGRVQEMSKHLKGGAEFAANPVEWVRKTLIPLLEAKGITDPVEQAKAVSSFSGRQTTAGFLGEIVRAIAAINKESENLAHTKLDSFEHLQANDPSQAIRNFDAAWVNLLASLGENATGDAVKMLNRLTDGLNALSVWAKENPNAARLLVDTAGGLGAIATALGALSTAIFLFGPAIRLLTGGAAAAATAAAEGAAASVLGPAAAAAATGLLVYKAGTDPHFATIGPEVEAQLRRSRELARDPFGLGRPQDGYDESGNPVGGNTRVNLTPPRGAGGTIRVEVTNPGQIGEAAAGGTVRRIERDLARPQTGATGFDPRMSPPGMFVP